jgi:SAM-dependent methyltransferase
MRRMRRGPEPHEHRTYRAEGPNPFAGSPLRRHAWAYEQVRDVDGPHLDVGCNRGAFAGLLSETTARVGVGVDVDRDDLLALRRAWPSVAAVAADASAGLPFAPDSFGSVSLLDVAEHVSDDVALLEEARRVVRPGGVVVVTLPAQHVFSWLDPDDLVFRFPRLHRFAWSLRYGRDAYARRFDRSEALCGDIASSRGGHTNYEPSEIATRLGRAGLLVEQMEGNGYWFRWLQIPALSLPRRLAELADRAVVRDGNRFTGRPRVGITRRANLFVVARRPARA